MKRIQRIKSPPLGPQPPPAQCACGIVYAWERFPRPGTRWAAQGYSPFWCKPHTDPCSVCLQAHRAQEAARAFERLQHTAGVSPRYRGFTWDKAAPELSEDGGTAGLRERLGRPEWLGYLGVPRGTAAAAQAMRGWSPRAGHSIYLEGGVGTGKTAWASATVNRLLRRPEPTVREMDAEMLGAWLAPAQQIGARALGRHTVYRQPPSWSPVIATNDDLYERVRLSWERDRTPLAALTDAPALVLDDLGSVGGRDGNRRPPPPGAIEAVQRLIRERYRTSMMLIVTSNLAFKDVANVYGLRVSSRLREMCGRHVYSLGVFDWRQ